MTKKLGCQPQSLKVFHCFGRTLRNGISEHPTADREDHKQPALNSLFCVCVCLARGVSARRELDVDV